MMPPPRTTPRVCRHPLLALALAGTLFVASGQNCAQSTGFRPVIGTRDLPTAPTMPDIINLVNSNTDRVQSLYSTDASFSVPGVPTLRASLALDRPRRLRLRAETAFTGSELDLGSNDELFWLWVRRQQPPAIYFCRHDQYQGSAANRLLPVEPDWIIEAVGLTRFDPADQHRGPFPLGGGKLRVDTQLNTTHGPMTKVTVLDANRGWVLEQHLYDSAGQRIALALTSKHEREAASGATLPHRIEIEWPATQFSMRIDIGTLYVNRVAADPVQFYQMPAIPGANPVNLALPGLTIPGAMPTASVPLTVPR